MSSPNQFAAITMKSLADQLTDIANNCDPIPLLLRMKSELLQRKVLRAWTLGSQDARVMTEMLEKFTNYIDTLEKTRHEQRKLLLLSEPDGADVQDTGACRGVDGNSPENAAAEDQTVVVQPVDPNGGTEGTADVGPDADSERPVVVYSWCEADRLGLS